METEKSKGELLFYIQTQTEAGVSREEIIKRLSKAEWKEDQIHSSLDAYDRGERKIGSSFHVFFLIIKRLLYLFFTNIIIITILAYVLVFVLAFVLIGDSRDQAGKYDPSIMQSIKNTKSQTEIIYNRDGAYVYSAVCGSDGFDQNSSMIQLLKAAESHNPSGEKTICNSSAEAFAISARLYSDRDASYFCVDSVGFAGTIPRKLHPGELRCPVDEFVK